jgi:hypothetical protein
MHRKPPVAEEHLDQRVAAGEALQEEEASLF